MASTTHLAGGRSRVRCYKGAVSASLDNLAPAALPRTVAITGISGNLGRALAKNLHTEARLIGIDRRPFRERPKDIEHHEVDIRKKKAEDVFRRGHVDALIHMGIMHDPRMPHSEA